MSAEGADWTCAPCAGNLFSMQRCELCRLALLLLWLCYRDPERHANLRWNELIQIDDYQRRRLLLNVALFIHLILIVALTLIILWLTPCWPVLRWFVAFVYILVVGHYGSAVFLCALRTWFMGQRRESNAGVPGNLMGFFERLLFMGVVWFVASVYPDNGTAVAAAAFRLEPRNIGHTSPGVRQEGARCYVRFNDGHLKYGLRNGRGTNGGGESLVLRGTPGSGEGRAGGRTRRKPEGALRLGGPDDVRFRG